MGLTAPEMTVLIGGFRSLGISSDNMGVFTNDHNSLSNDFFTNLLDMSVDWKKSDNGQYLGTNKSSSSEIRRASRVDLVFGSNSQLRAISELYACDDSKGRFIDDFIAVWNKVMNFDRFDIK
jgi:catalase-peroxidase